MISASAGLSLLVSLVIIGLIFWLVWWFITWVGLPEPFAKIAKVLIGLFALVYLINLLLSLTGTHLFR